MLRPFVFSSLYIAIGAVSLSLFYQFTANSIHVPRTLIIGLATFMAYNIVQIMPLFKRSPISERGQWIFRHRKPLWTCIGICLLLITVLSQFLILEDIVNFAHLLLLSLLYEGTVTKKGLRSIPFLKPFLISYVWAMSCAFPVFGFYANLATVECFFFIFSLCLLFDLRDIQDDSRQGIKTFATSYGTGVTKVLSTSSFLIALLLVLSFSSVSYILLGVFSSAGILAIYKSAKNTSDLYYLYVVDGLILTKLFLLLEVF